MVSGFFMENRELRMENETVALILHSQLLRYSRYRIKCLTGGKGFYRVVKLRQNLPEIGRTDSCAKCRHRLPFVRLCEGRFFLPL